MTTARATSLQSPDLRLPRVENVEGVFFVDSTCIGDFMHWISCLLVVCRCIHIFSRLRRFSARACVKQSSFSTTFSPALQTATRVAG